ncbi:MAG: DNA methyltransferase [Agathobacter sp.]
MDQSIINAGGAGYGIAKVSLGGGIWQDDKRRKEERGYAFTGRRRDGVSGAKNRCYGSFAVTETKITNEKYPTSIISMDKEHDGNYHHPTQKPVNLMRWLIRTFTNEGELILDNCMGSGTTAVACIKEKMHFIGYEITKEYYDVACERIKQEKANLTLF